MTTKTHTPPTLEGTVSECRLSYTQSGIPLLKVNFFCSYLVYSKAEQGMVPSKTYYTFTLWRDEAEAVDKLVEIDCEIRVTGFPKIRTYKDKDDVEQIAKTPEILSPKVDMAFLRAQTGQAELAPAATGDLF